MSQLQTAPEAAPETAEAAENNEFQKPMWLLEHFFQLLAGMLVATGILAIQVGPQYEWTLWIPAAAMLLTYVIGFWPRSPKKERIYEEPPAPVPIPAVEETAQASPVPAAAPAEAAPQPAPRPAASKPAAPLDKNTVLILWGSETGNAEGLANMTQDRLNEAGQAARAMSLGELKAADLQGYAKVLVITSTWGDGEPPSNAIDIWEALQKETLDLSGLHFSVLALGDTAYPQFCQCGKDFDNFLAQHGGKRIHPRVDCDLDYEAPFEKWYTGVSKALQGELVPA